MTCEHIKIGDMHAIVCTRGPKSRPKPCEFCNRPSTQLCDFPVETFVGHDGKKHAAKTCDKRLCGVCARRGKSGRDYCPSHFR